MKKFYKVEDFFPAEGDQRFSLSEESPLDNVTYNVFTADDFTDAAIYDYGERLFLAPETTTPLASFYGRFARWKAQRGKDIAAAFGALRKKYNPLENYKMIETHTGDDTKLQTPSNWKKETVQTPDGWQEKDFESYNGYKEKETFKPDTTRTETESYPGYKESEKQSPDGWTKETTELIGDNAGNVVNKIVPFNNSTPQVISETTTENKAKSSEAQKGTFTTSKEIEGLKIIKTADTGAEDREKTKEGIISRTHAQEGTYTTSEEQSGTFEDKTTYNTTLNRSGNIGVTTSQQMAASELDLRMKQFVRDVIREFFDTVTVYC